jgi:glycine betaine/proline transport system permease protein
MADLRFSSLGTIPLDDWVDWFIKDWLVPNFRPAFRAIQAPVDFLLENVDALLQAIPFPIFLIAVAALAWRASGTGLAVFTFLSLALIDLVGVWTEAMTTLSMVITAVLFCSAVGVPLGILAARSDRFAAGIRPVLDIMQTIPPFVYLVPIVMLFGVGLVPGVIATIIFAIPPVIRFTNLGIRQVQGEMVEAGYAFGATRRQVLFEIEIPLAMRTIMAGLNQTLMLALSMVVIAAMIGAGGLGLTVFTGLGRLDVGRAFIGGLGIVLIAIIMDRITQSFGESRKPSGSVRRLARTLLRGARPEGTGEPVSAAPHASQVRPSH